VGDGIARVSGVRGAMLGEMLEFGGGLFGLALNLEEDRVGVVLLGASRHIKEGDAVPMTSPQRTRRVRFKPPTASFNSRPSEGLAQQGATRGA